MFHYSIIRRILFRNSFDPDGKLSVDGEVGEAIKTSSSASKMCDTSSTSFISASLSLFGVFFSGSLKQKFKEN